MDFSNILSHPDKDEIISKLLTGSEPKAIAEWLKIKYSEKSQAHLRLSIKSLQDFSKSPYADMYKQFETDLVAVQTGAGTLNKNVASSLLNNKTYQERLNELADTELDIKKMLRGTIMMINDRAIQLFDKAQENPGIIGKSEYALIKWIEQLLSATEKYDKIINNAPDQIIQHNYTIQYIDQQTAAIQDAIRDVILAELDADTSMRIIEKLSNALSKVKAPPEGKPVTQEVRMAEAQILQEYVATIEDNEGGGHEE